MYVRWNETMVQELIFVLSLKESMSILSVQCKNCSLNHIVHTVYVQYVHLSFEQQDSDRVTILTLFTPITLSNLSWKSAHNYFNSCFLFRPNVLEYTVKTIENMLLYKYSWVVLAMSCCVTVLEDMACHCKIFLTVCRASMKPIFVPSTPLTLHSDFSHYKHNTRHGWCVHVWIWGPQCHKLKSCLLMCSATAHYLLMAL